jgi:hypothetical protein
MGAKQLCFTVGRYANRHYYELPANILEGITLVSVSGKQLCCRTAGGWQLNTTLANFGLKGPVW